MADMRINIAGREYSVACQAGEESALELAVARLQSEAQDILEQTGRISEAQVLLLAGLLLADRVCQLELDLKKAKKIIMEQEDISACAHNVLAVFAKEAEHLADSVEHKAKL